MTVILHSYLRLTDMLSYQHAFHAGNHADVLKHLVLSASLGHALQKPAPLFYLDTHAGAGLYRLDSREAEKTGEAQAGILKLDFPSLLTRLPTEGAAILGTYYSALQPFLGRHAYPGSPLLAAALLRPQDHLHLFELHPAEYALLLHATHGDRRIQCEQADAFKRSLALLPPVQKRAVILIDPPYEIKDDYLQAAELAVRIHKRMPGAQILLWYPVVKRGDVGRIIGQLQKGAVRDLWQFELGLVPDNDDYGMTASGMLVINPPWTLAAAMDQCLPLLQEVFAPATGHWKADNLLAE
jgi:23S rRNA (adenine2030-N6)-methyltransferase